MQRKPGGYRSPSKLTRLLSLIPAECYAQWFRRIWHDVTGASTAKHPAPYPELLAERLVRMFSFVGDTVLDPFMGTATTNFAAAKWGRNSIGVEVDEAYYQMSRRRMEAINTDLYFQIEPAHREAGGASIYPVRSFRRTRAKAAAVGVQREYDSRPLRLLPDPFGFSNPRPDPFGFSPSNPRQVPVQGRMVPPAEAN